jgi:hypothetical protein
MNKIFSSIYCSYSIGRDRTRQMKKRGIVGIRIEHIKISSIKFRNGKLSAAATKAPDAAKCEMNVHYTLKTQTLDYWRNL